MTALQLKDNTVQLVKEAADIVAIIGECVTLQRSGANFKGCCPFHSEKTPSFIVNPERRSYHCFGCGEGGDVLSFIMNYHRLSFPEALNDLAKRYQIALPEKTLSQEEQAELKQRDALYRVSEQAADFYHQLLLESPEAEPARRYLADRGIPAEVISSFKLGFAPDRWDSLVNKLGVPADLVAAEKAGLLVKKERGGYYDRFRNRVLFPIFSPTGKVIAFGGRILGDGQPKYLNSPETPLFDKSRTLFGLYQNRLPIRDKRQCLLVEGNFDLIALVTHGIANVAAPLGTALTKGHIRTLKGYADEAVLLFDGDDAGLKAAMRAVPIFLSEQLPARIVTLPANHDPDTFVREFGGDGLKKMIDDAASLAEFVFRQLVEKHGLSVEGKGKVVQELKPIIEAITDPLQRKIFVAHFSEQLGITTDEMLTAYRPPAAPPIAPKETTKQPPVPIEQLPIIQRQLIEFLILYPEYLQQFMEAGIDDLVTHSTARTILDALRNQNDSDTNPAPEQILPSLAAAERNFVSKLLISTPSFSDEDKEREAEEKIAWLKKTNLTIQRKKLTRLINEAQQSQNIPLCMELIAQKRAIEERLAS
ncbi:MAG: DNA primase [Desulfobulbaceae bacterium]|nr:DNA primase [Desulfobulbaceae bacterium]